MRLLGPLALSLFLASTALADPQAPLKGKSSGFMKGRPGPGGRPTGPVDRFNRLSPSERREVLEKLPPERREVMERRLERWRNTPPAERRRLEGSYARFQEMSPERQEEVRTLFRRFRETFPPDRAPAAHSAIRRLRRADAEERKNLLNNRRFQSDFTEEERKIIEQMATELPERE